MNETGYRQFVGFAAAGVAGFAVDLALLGAAIAAGNDPLLARAGTIFAAVVTTYLINRWVTSVAAVLVSATSWASSVGTLPPAAPAPRPIGCSSPGYYC
jgi:putative flippase GtrA